jgi:hypothetical protein
VSNNTWEMDEDGGLMLDPYYESDDYDDDAFDWRDEDQYEFDDDDLIEGVEPTALEAWRSAWYWRIQRWLHPIHEYVHRCPDCHKRLRDCDCIPF